MQATAIDPACVVNDVIAQYPQTTRVFNYFGIDTCCGGGSTIHEAAQEDLVDEEVLIDSLMSAVRYSQQVAQRS